VSPCAGKAFQTGRMNYDSPDQNYPDNCELGDLHLVFVFLDNNKNIRKCRSILFQAKKDAPIKKANSSYIAHKTQSYLYEKADGFEYRNICVGPRNWPTGEDREKALHYLFCGSADVVTSSACAPGEMGFGELIFGFLTDSQGLHFEIPELLPPHWANWSRINWDLLNTVANRTFKKAPRSYLVTDVLNHFNDFTDYNEYYLESEDKGGIPTMFVIVKDRKLESQNLSS